MSFIFADLDFATCETLEDHLDGGIVALEDACKLVLLALDAQLGRNVARDQVVGEVWRAFLADEAFKVTGEVGLHDGGEELAVERHGAVMGVFIFVYK